MHFFSVVCKGGKTHILLTKNIHTLHAHLFLWQQDERGYELRMTGISHTDHYVLLEGILLGSHHRKLHLQNPNYKEFFALSERNCSRTKLLTAEYLGLMNKTKNICKSY